MQIECYIEELKVDGNTPSVQIRGADGYRLERDGERYNIFWNGDKIAQSLAADKILTASVETQAPKKTSTISEDRLFQILLSAKENHSKIRLEGTLKNKTFTITSATLL